MFEQFYPFALLPRNFASYFVTSIPKVKSLGKLSDFMPISLVESLYKLVTKVFAIRLWKVMDKLVAPNK